MPLCSCRQNSHQDLTEKDQKDLQVVPFNQISSTPDIAKPKKFISKSSRKYNSNESLVSKDARLLNSMRRCGSFESINPHESSATETSCNRSRVSELSDYEDNEPVFVDIPTLVAVLIKPDTSQEHSTQIEEICSDGLLEGSIESEFLEGSDGNQNRKDTFSNEQLNNEGKENVVQSTEIVSTTKDDTNNTPFRNDLKRVRENCLKTEDKPKEKVKLKKQDSVDTPLKKLNNLQVSRAFGSAEGLAKKREVPSLIQRSHTNLEKRTGPEKLKKLNNIKEVEDRRTNSRIGSFWRGLGQSSSKDLHRKGSNDSDKSLKDSVFLHKRKSPLRKLSIDGLKRKTSKDSSSSSSREDQQFISGLVKGNYQRKGSFDQESPGRAHTPIQRNSRAQIVAAVTERLYSSGKKSEEGTGATTPVSDYRSPESTDVKLAAVTRMRLQEISRRMLAKRRKISADTQTDNAQTVRVRDSASLTEEPEIEYKDVAILTDQHEDCERLSKSLVPVVRVKEMATLTEKRRLPTVRCKDAGNITDDFEEDYDLHSSRNDSGILSDDTQNYADSNISSAETLDFVDHERRNVGSTENSTNTTKFSEGVDCSAQTRKDDLVKPKLYSHCESQCCSRVHECCCHQSHSCHSHGQRYGHGHTQSISSSEKSVISINLPDMISITIESPNILESRISLVDGEERLRTNSRDCEVQTDARTALERGTSTDDINDRVSFNDFVVKTKPNASQTDGKTFRIENIFQEPKTTRTYPRIEMLPCSEEDLRTSITFTKSVGTSMDHLSIENGFGLEPRSNFNYQPPLKTFRRRLSLIRERSVLDSNILRRRSRSFSPSHRTRSILQSRYPSSERIQKLNPVQEVLLERAKSGYLNPCQSREVPSENQSSSCTRVFDQYFTTSRGEVNFFSTKELQNSNLDECWTQKEFEPLKVEKTLDSYFSDDSLDPMEDGASYFCNQNKEAKVDKVSKKICPPDVVAHTKKENLKVTDHDGETSVTSEYDEEIQESCESNSNIRKKKVSFSSPSIVETETQSLTDSKQIGLVPKSIIKKKREDVVSDQEALNSQENNCNQLEILDSSSNFSENSSSSKKSSRDEQKPTSCRRKPRNQKDIIDNYFEEAVTFIRNVNSINDYVTASNILKKYLRSTRPSRRLPRKNRDYIEYAGQRVSLKDDTDQYFKEEEIVIPTKAYEKCLEGIEKLEECIGRAKDHDSYLRDKYGIGIESAGAKPGLVTSNQDSMDFLNHQDYKEHGDSFYDMKINTLHCDNDFDSDNNIIGSDHEGNLDTNLNENVGSKLDTDFEALLDSRISDYLSKGTSTSFKIPENASYSNFTTKNELTAEDDEIFLEDPDSGDVQDSQIGHIKTPNCFLSIPKRVNYFSKRWKSPTFSRHSSLPRLTSSSNESFSSSETIAASSESIDSISNHKNKINYPGSPRARFLQLLNERRRIVEKSRKVSQF